MTPLHQRCTEPSSKKGCNSKGKKNGTPNGIPLGRVFAFGEDSFALLLTSELDALCGENVNRTLQSLRLADPFQIWGFAPPKQKGHSR